MLDENNPYTLFLVLVLLLLSVDDDSDAKLMTLRDVVDQAAKSAGTMRQEINSMQANLEQARAVFMGGPGKPG